MVEPEQTTFTSWLDFRDVGKQLAQKRYDRQFKLELPLNFPMVADAENPLTIGLDLVDPVPIAAVDSL